jgi:hypothetical protein
MAIINIPVGGVAVGIEIPDFTLDYTSQQMLNELKQQTSILQTGTQAQVAALNNLSGGGLSGRLASSAANIGNNNESSGLSRIFTGIEAGFTQLIANAGIQEAVQKMFDGFGFPRVGAALGTIVGIVEQASESMAKLSRVGANAGTSLIDLRNDAANVGLGLEQVTAYVSTFGTTITSLGKNSTEGTNRLLEFVGALREETKAVGYFGMTATEMAQYMIDELEIRRQLTTTMEMQNLNAQQMSIALKEQYMQQMAVARLTGQDVHARIRARMDMDRNADFSAAMAGLNDQQANSARIAVQAMTELGPAVQQMMQKGLTNMMLGLNPAIRNEGFGEFAGVAQGVAGIDVYGAFEQVAAAINANDDQMAQAIMSQLAIQFDNMNETQKVQLGILSAGGGVEGATMALTVSMQATPPVVNAMNQSLAGLVDAIDQAAGEIATSANLRIAGMRQDSEVMIQQLQAAMFNAILGATGTSALNETESIEALMGVMQMGVDATAGAQDLARMAAEVMSTLRDGGVASVEALTPDTIGQGVRDALSDFFDRTAANIAENRAIMAELSAAIRSGAMFQ